MLSSKVKSREGIFERNENVEPTFSNWCNPDCWRSVSLRSGGTSQLWEHGRFGVCNLVPVFSPRAALGDCACNCGLIHRQKAVTCRRDKNQRNALLDCKRRFFPPASYYWQRPWLDVHFYFSGSCWFRFRFGFAVETDSTQSRYVADFCLNSCVVDANRHYP
jgi:hypothetical protein